MTTFCSQIVDLICLQGVNDVKDLESQWKVKAEKGTEEENDEKDAIKNRNKVLFMTPGTAQKLYKSSLLKKSECYSIIVDKLNMH